MFLRPSCYHCPFKGLERASDITIGDFWGIEKFLPGFGDQYGISSVIIHTDKGHKLYQQIQNELVTQPCVQDWVSAENPCILKPTPENDQRSKFFRKWKDNGVICTVNELTKLSVRKKLLLGFRNKFMYVLELVYAIKRHIFNR